MSPKEILYTEDHSVLATIVIDVLRSRLPNANIHHAENQRKALEIIAEIGDRLSLAICDLRIPEGKTENKDENPSTEAGMAVIKKVLENGKKVIIFTFNPDVARLEIEKLGPEIKGLCLAVLDKGGDTCKNFATIKTALDD